MQVMQISRRMSGILAVLLVTLVFGGVAAAPASADSFSDKVAQVWIVSQVYAEPSAKDQAGNPAMAQADTAELSQVIRDSGKNIFVAVLGADQVKTTTPRALADSMHASLGANTSEVIGIVTEGGVYAQTYNVSSLLAGNVASITDRLDAHIRAGADSRPAITGAWWIGAMTSLSGWTPPSTTPIRAVAAAQGSDMSNLFEGIFIGMLVSAAILALCGFILGSQQRRKQAEEAQRKQQLEQDAAILDEMVDDLDERLELIDDAVAHLDGEAGFEYAAARMQIAFALQALHYMDLESARAYLSNAQSHYDNVSQAIESAADPSATVSSSEASGVPAAPATTQQDAPALADTQVTSISPVSGASSTDRLYFRHPRTKQIVVIENHPFPHPTNAFQHYWGGGRIGDVELLRGFYAHKVWAVGWGKPLTSEEVAAIDGVSGNALEFAIGLDDGKRSYDAAVDSADADALPTPVAGDTSDGRTEVSPDAAPSNAGSLNGGDSEADSGQQGPSSSTDNC